MKKLFLNPILLLSLIMSMITGCGYFSTDSETSIEEHEKVIDIALPDQNYNLLIGININPNATASPEQTGPLSNLPDLNFNNNSLNMISTNTKHTSIPDIPQHHFNQINFSNHFTFSMQTMTAQTQVTSETNQYTFQVFLKSSSGTNNISATQQKYTGSKQSNCLIFVEDESNVDTTINFNDLNEFCSKTVTEIAKEFVPSCKPNSTGKLDPRCDVDENNSYIILYYDFPKYLGYVNRSDLLDKISLENYNNEFNTSYPYIGKEIIYLNINKTLLTNQDTLNKQTIAHEYQHLLSYHITQRFNGHQAFDVWIEEGLAEAAAHHMTVLENLDNNKHQSHRLNNFTNSNIRDGNVGLIGWGTNHVPQHYSYVYLFFQYLRIHSTNSIYQQIHNQQDTTYKGIEEVFLANSKDFVNFQDILASFHIATIINRLKPSKFGFKDVDGFKNEQITSKKSFIKNRTSKSISPGGRIIANLPLSYNVGNFIPSNSDDNIRFYRIK